MKNIGLALLTFLAALSLGLNSPGSGIMDNTKKVNMEQDQDSLLRHVVLFKFKEEAPAEKIKEIEEAFSALPSKIPQVAGYEWGTNNSPEGLNKGLTHCFFVTFKSEADRAAYLPHPDHKAFVALLGTYLEDVTVIDYWTN